MSGHKFGTMQKWLLAIFASFHTYSFNAFTKDFLVSDESQDIEEEIGESIIQIGWGVRAQRMKRSKLAEQKNIARKTILFFADST